MRSHVVGTALIFLQPGAFSAQLPWAQGVPLNANETICRMDCQKHEVLTHHIAPLQIYTV